MEFYCELDNDDENNIDNDDNSLLENSKQFFNKGSSNAIGYIQVA